MCDFPGCALSQRILLMGWEAETQPVHQGTIPSQRLHPPKGARFFLICPRVPWGQHRPAPLGLVLRKFLRFFRAEDSLKILLNGGGGERGGKVSLQKQGEEEEPRAGAE